MDLQGLETYLAGQGDPLTITAADARLPRELRDFLSAAPSTRLTFTDVELEPGEGTLTVTGGSAGRWPVQGLTGVEVGVERLTLTLTEDGAPPVTCQAAGSMPLGASVTAPVTVTSAQDTRSGAWRIALSEDAPVVSPVGLLLLGKPDAEAPFPIPPGVEAIAAEWPLPAPGLGVTFYPGTDAEAHTMIDVPLPGVHWPVLPSVLELDGLSVRADLTTTTYSVLLAGEVVVGGVAMEVGIGMGGRAPWLASVRPAGGGAFPGVAALAGWATGGDAAGSALAAMDINGSAFDLAIGAIGIAFDPFAPALRHIEVTGLLTVGALEFDVALRLPDLEVRGSLREDRPVPLADVLDSYGLPTAGVPDGLRITQAALSADVANGDHLLRLAVDGVWAAGPIDIAELDVAAGYLPATGITGAVHGVIDLGSAAHLTVMAGYEGPPAGWAFRGGTMPGSALDIGELLAELTARFGVADVPEAVRGLALSGVWISYRTGTGEFTFTCRGDLRVTEAPVAVLVDIGISPVVNGSRAISFDGEARVAVGGSDLRFDARFGRGADAKRFVAAYSHPGSEPGAQPDTTPPPDVKSLLAAFAPSAADLIPEGLAVDVRDVVFAVDQTTGGTTYLFMADIAATVDFAGLPLVGDHFGAMGVDPLRILVASGPVAADQVRALNALLPDGVARLPERDIPAGFAIDTVLRLGELTVPLALPVSGAGNAPPAASTGTAGSATPPAVPSGGSTAAVPTADDATWLKVQRGFGPVQVARVGLAFGDGRLAVLVDAAITAAGLTLSLDGLVVELSLADPGAVPEFGLRGLGLAYASGPVGVGGAFLRGEIVYEGRTYPAYSGSAQLTTETFGLAAIGSYAQLPEGPALFVYAYLDQAIGGPPVFFVRGLAAGFGYNRRLVPPAIDDVAAFPLVAEAVGGRKAGSLAGELAALASYLPPSAGDYFLAAGVHFTSFQMIDSFVLLAVTFGHRFEVDVLGLSTLVLPAPDAAAAGAPPIAEVQLALRAAFVPEDGVLAVAARLTRDSFLLSRDCHLTGGFAFSTWFAGDNDGDFVVSAGGYHPRYPVPAHYPAVPRLGFSWQVSPQLSLSGSAYFALTPSALMAGGALHANWRDDTLHAWFDGSMDFLIAWQPYHYQASLHVAVGVTYTFSEFGNNTISAQVNADVDLWGPEFSGTATVDLGVVSFTVAFGAGDAGAPRPVPWPRFAAALLPGPGEIVTLALRGDVRRAPGADATDLGVVDAAGLVLVTDSAIPCTAAARGPESEAEALPADGATTRFGVGPAGVATGGVTSTQRVSISREGDPVDAALTYTPVRKNLPFALWGDRLTPSANDPRLIPDMLTGYEIRPSAPAEPDRRPWVYRSALQAASSLADRPGAIRLEVPASFTPVVGDPGEREAEIARALSADDVAAARDAVVRAVLPGAPIDPGDGPDFLEIPQVGSYV